MKPRHWITIALGLALLAAALVVGGYLVNNVPVVTRLVYGVPPTATPRATLRPTFTALLPTATQPSAPTATQPPAPTATAGQATPMATAASGSSSSTPSPIPLTATSAPPTDTPLPPTPTPKPQWIAYETHQKGRSDYEIFVMAPDGSDKTNLTNSWADDVAPVWSPDGRRIAFVSWRDTVVGKWGVGPGSIYVLDFDPATGTARNNAIRVTDRKTDDGWPTWSPDGKRIAFHSKKSGNWDIWVVNLDGSGLTNLTKQPGDDRFPAWSPDGTKIAFTSERSGNYDVWVMNADGSNPVNLTNKPGPDRYAMWSPDGRQIAFNTARDGNQEIYIMNADGSRQTNVTQAPKSTEGLADWSPDGKRLVLYSDRTGNKDIFILDLASRQWTNITKDPGSDEFCTWSP